MHVIIKMNTKRHLRFGLYMIAVFCKHIQDNCRATIISSSLIMGKLIIIVLVSFVSVVEASSSLTDVTSNYSKNVDDLRKTNCTDILRQLLNQETLMRMSLSKDVHTVMNTMFELKEKQIKMESKVTDLQKEVDNLKQENQQLKQENQAGNREIKSLQEQLAFVRQDLIKVNQTSNEIEDNILQITENQKVFELQVKQRENDFERNTSEILKDLKIELRYMSVTLLDLRKYTLEIDKNIPRLVASNIKSFSGHMNKSIEEIVFNMTGTQAEQRGLVSAITQLEIFRSNISKMTTDSISQMKEEIHQTRDTQLKQTAKISTLEFKVNISNKRSTVGFTAGTVSGDSSWLSGTLVFPKIIYDVGGGYNAGTGVFTAPIAGDYFFCVTLVSYNDQNIKVDIVLNGTSKVRTRVYPAGGSSYETGTNMVLMRLKQGDQVWIKRHDGKGYYSQSVPLSTFSGFLL